MPVVIYILPFIGKRPIDKIVAPELVAMVKEIEQRDALEIAKRTPQTSGQIFRYAIAHGFATRNPASEPMQAKRIVSSLVLISRTNFSRNFVRVLSATVRHLSAVIMQ